MAGDKSEPPYPRRLLNICLDDNSLEKVKFKPLQGVSFTKSETKKE